MLPLASFTSSDLYNSIYKITSSPVIFWGNHIWYVLEFIIAYLIVINWPQAIAGVFKNLWFSFARVFIE